MDTNLTSHSRLTWPFLLVTIGAALVVARPAHAQNGDPRAFRACLVPTVGAMYLIGEDGLPQTCLSESHEEIQWTENGDGTVTLLDGSVTTPKIAAEAATSDKLADGAVGADQLASEAPEPATGADTARRVRDGPNSGTTPLRQPRHRAYSRPRHRSVRGRHRRRA